MNESTREQFSLFHQEKIGKAEMAKVEREITDLIAAFNRLPNMKNSDAYQSLISLKEEVSSVLQGKEAVTVIDHKEKLANIRAQFFQNRQQEAKDRRPDAEEPNAKRVRLNN